MSIWKQTRNGILYRDEDDKIDIGPGLYLSQNPDGDAHVVQELARGVYTVNRNGVNAKVPRMLSATDPTVYVPGNLVQSVSNAVAAIEDNHTNVGVSNPRNRWGVVLLPAGVHTLSGPIALRGINMSLVGPEGSMGDEGITSLATTPGTGMCTLVTASSQHGITFDEGINLFAGPTIQNVCILSGGGSGNFGVYIKGANNFRLRNINTGNFSGAGSAGLRIIGNGTSTQYAYIEHFRNFSSKYGVWISDSSGFNFYRLMLSGNRNGSDAIASGSIGFWQDSTLQGTNQVVGANIQGYDWLAAIESDEGSVWTASRLEHFTNYGLNLSKGGTRNQEFQFLGGTINNFLGSGAGTGIYIGTGVLRTMIVCQHVLGVSTVYNNSSGSNDHTKLIANELFVNAGRNWGRQYMQEMGIAMENNTTLGSVTNKFKAYDASGTFIGYVPVYT